jgi:hypothetical protein
MILIYILFALAAATVLISFLANWIPDRRRGDMFIAFFSLLGILGWGIAAGNGRVVVAADTPVVLSVVFATILAVCTILAVKVPAAARRVPMHISNSRRSEAVIFDLLLWLSTLMVGVVALGSVLP